jgi:nucleoside-diphosphate-sugar epimerase
MTPELSIREEFDGAVVLLTGVTGFVGGMLLEQLLRCTTVSVFLLSSGGASRRGQRERERRKRLSSSSPNFFSRKRRRPPPRRATFPLPPLPLSTAPR